ncbi:MAG: outer membrane beta-barrel protein, partial [Gammaproteobacteria bacterium]|nr:outer membrane beta-barrel protein [Gammaproteobacteria bacterium]
MKPRTPLFNALLAALTLLLSTNLASADEGFSVGASVVRASVEAQGLGHTVNGDADGSRIFGSYMFTRRFGIEAGYSDFGRPDDNTIAPNVEVESTSYDLYAVGVKPVTDKLDLFGKLGLVRSDTEIEESETSE